MNLKKFTYLNFVIMALLQWAMPVYAQNRTVEMKASLPSAYANIYRMKLADNGTTPPIGTSCYTGEVAMFTGVIYQCNSQNLWEPLGGIWSQNRTTNTVYLTNPDSAPLGVAIGTNQKEFRLTLDNDGGIIAKGTVGSGADLSSTGTGAKLIWYPKKGAFRAGTVMTNAPPNIRSTIIADGTTWDDNNIGLNSFAVGLTNKASGTGSSVAGGAYNYANGTVLVGGLPAWGYAAIGGGWSNLATGPFSYIGGGAWNQNKGVGSVIGGGGGSEATANTIESFADHSFIGGGQQNFIGDEPPAGTAHNVIGGGFMNRAFGNSSTVGGGRENRAIGNASTVAGGVNNDATGTRTFIGGGLNNTASFDQAVVAGGQDNVASAHAAFVGGGIANQATFGAATIVGGEQNEATGQYSFIGGGFGNEVNQISASVVGGYENEATGQWSSVLGGLYNRAGGQSSSVLGGDHNQAVGEDSIAAGENVHVLGSNSFGFGRNMRLLANNTFAFGQKISLGDIAFADTFIVLSEKSAIGDRETLPASLSAKLTVWGSPTDNEDIAVYMDDIMQIKPRPTAPACNGNADIGKIFVDSDKADICFCNGNKWQGLSTGSECN